MRITFLQQALDEQSLFHREAAARRSIAAGMVEKDFWVCWMLGVLFGHPQFGQNLVFKGGTSLSKVFGIIQRFSEDIDLSLAPSFVGISEEEVERALSRNQRDKWMQRLEEACIDAVKFTLMPALEKTVADSLGKRPGGHSWLEFSEDTDTNSPVVFFHYPSPSIRRSEYLRPAVKLEFGSLTDQKPVGSHSVRPWVAEEFPDAFQDWNCKVISLDSKRTFWEKATILHAEYHRSAEDAVPDRFSRHYADIAALSRHPSIMAALDDAVLRERVADWKGRFFARSWARYDLARPGTFRLVPPKARHSPLKSDYLAMRDMFIHPPPSFEEVLSALNFLETKINDLG